MSFGLTSISILSHPSVVVHRSALQHAIHYGQVGATRRRVKQVDSIRAHGNSVHTVKSNSTTTARV